MLFRPKFLWQTLWKQMNPIIKVLVIYRACWIGLYVVVEKKCSGHWNCRIGWFEFFLLTLSELTVKCVRFTCLICVRFLKDQSKCEKRIVIFNVQHNNFMEDFFYLVNGLKDLVVWISFICYFEWTNSSTCYGHYLQTGF
jgi:hypothetical protein